MISKNLTKYIRQLEQKKARKREGLFVAEGHKVVGDLLKHSEAKLIVATGTWLHENHPLCEQYEVTDEELQRISFLQHPQQVIGLFPIPPSNADFADNGLYLALDGIQDPGNLGTIIRVADWFGISKIFCSPDTADAYNPKVIQATMGSIARTEITYTDLTSLLSHAIERGMPVYGTFLDGENIYQQTLTPNGIIVMGNEGNGISMDVKQTITNRLLIPDSHQGETADSLNVAIATAITCSEFRRRSYL